MKRFAKTAMIILALGTSHISARANYTVSVHAFLMSYLSGAGPGTRVAIAFSDLNGGGKNEVVIYVMGPGWCGTGGCDALVLSPKGSTYSVVMDASVSQLPISVLPTKSHGNYDLPAGIAMMIDVGLFGHPLFYGARHEDPFLISHGSTTERLTDLPMKVYA